MSLTSISGAVGTFDELAEELVIQLFYFGKRRSGCRCGVRDLRVLESGADQAACVADRNGVGSVFRTKFFEHSRNVGSYSGECEV